MDRTLQKLLSAITEGGNIRCSGEDGYKALEIMVAIHYSDSQGHLPIALPLEGDILRQEFKVT